MEDCRDILKNFPGFHFNAVVHYLATFLIDPDLTGVEEEPADADSRTVWSGNLDGCNDLAFHCLTHLIANHLPDLILIDVARDNAACGNCDDGCTQRSYIL